ncbi:UDP-N-acetylglucosamine 2-epimerase (non-hydrolyzing) [Phreatobacter aquaticus]|uniref:UDP-N-acetylglucosamine 2-epimerase (Non-hydrolyzing) n=1 Tax=Phreatobacter aquaticus TaxID=2570229 RepID=A0A4D7QIW5_9HYPH|nr:UDP-N-acetylglucosamine 2-epimerase (non-hydrolyzing) [Phreatobacter aquaticus]QCK87610.1 UDP-N-acetylglucosamine 2-epimerase (non-hydrolyzing) [Phreatobacter aquaticus]
MDEFLGGSAPQLKVLTLVGTRPELIKLSRIIAELDQTTRHVLVHSGQNHAPELASDLFADLELRRPDHWLDAAGASAIDTISCTLSRFDQVLASEAPDAVVIYGDTDTGLAALAAKRRRIPIFHLEAGNRCFDQVVPEEVNRRVIDHLSDINLTLSEQARRLLLAEGLPADRIFKIGSPMTEVLRHYAAKIERSTILETLGLDKRDYLIASVHRAENVDNERDLRSILASLTAAAEAYSCPVVVSTHPRTRKRLEALTDDLGRFQRLRFLPPFAFTDFVHLQRHALCVLSDSGSLTEEAAILDLPAVALRRQHERFEGMDEGTVIMGGIAPERVLQAIALALRHRRQGARSVRMIADYEPDDVSRHVVRLIVSYTDYVRRVVWNMPEGSASLGPC